SPAGENGDTSGGAGPMTGSNGARDAWFGGRARLVALERHADARGTLLPLEFEGLPFAPRRLFTVAGVPAGTVRGGHAHRQGQQLLICLQGRIDLCLRRAKEEARVTLVAAGPAMLVGANVWCEQTYVEAGSVLLV